MHLLSEASDVVWLPDQTTCGRRSLGPTAGPGAAIAASRVGANSQPDRVLSAPRRSGGHAGQKTGEIRGPAAPESRRTNTVVAQPGRPIGAGQGTRSRGAAFLAGSIGNLWSGQRESNPHFQLGRLGRYRYTMPAPDCAGRCSGLGGQALRFDSAAEAQRSGTPISRENLLPPSSHRSGSREPSVCDLHANLRDRSRA